MRKYLLSGLAFAFSVGLTLAGEVEFVKFNAETKELTVKESEKEATYKITDETSVKRGDKDVKLENVLKNFAEKTKPGQKFEITTNAEKKTITEIKFKAKAK